MEIGAIHLEYLNVNCSECLMEGEKQPTSVIIMPLRVIEENDMLKITTGCSMWKNCDNGACQFSKKNMDRNGDKRKERT